MRTVVWQGGPSLSYVSLLLVTALLTARWLVPTESAPEGETLWLAQLWLGTAIIVAWAFHRREITAWRFDLLDMALGGIVLGHVAAALVVIATEGDRRAAVNMAWEWVAVGVSVFCIRQTVVDRARRTALLALGLVLATGLAGLGIWQHAVWYPASVRSYDAMRGELDQLSKSTTDDFGKAIANEKRRRELQSELLREGVPLEGRSRMLWEMRLRSSTEPFGLFALTNTFAGFLAAWWIVLLGSRPNRASPLWWRAAWFAAVLLIAFCLILTKSRTAWVGSLCGVCVLFCTHRWKRALHTRQETGVAQGEEATSARRSIRTRWAIRGLVAVLLIGIVTVASTDSGFLDRAVLSEAPKSLRYRLEYWQATWAVIREHPLTGVGPGNFRQNYLEHKLPESSEEIADPHNLVLDVWVNGGLLALVGLAVLIVLAGLRAFRRLAFRDEGDRLKDVAPTAGDVSSQAICRGVFLGYGLVLVRSYFVDGAIDLRVASLFAFVLCGFFAGQWIRRGRLGEALALIPDSALHAGWIALAIHLLGAGGIGMPAISQLLFMLIVLSDLPASRSAESRSEGIRLSWCVPCPSDDGSRSSRRLPCRLSTWSLLGFAALFVGCLTTATVPVFNRHAHIRLGDADLLSDGNLTNAIHSYQRAAKADRLSAEPWERLMESALTQCQRSQFASSEFRNVITYGNEAVLRDPLNPNRHAQLGLCWLQQFEQTHEADSIRSAVEQYLRATELYPTSPEFQSSLSVAAWKADQIGLAKERARLSMRLDELNRTCGHVDRLLSDERRQQLQLILDEAVER